MEVAFTFWVLLTPGSGLLPKFYGLEYLIMSAIINVMVIDDDRDCLQSLDSALKLNGFNVRGFESPSQAIRQYDPNAVDAVITDYHFPKMKGTEVVKAIHRKKYDAPVIVITGDQDKRIETISLQTGASAFFRKPLEIGKIIAALEKVGSKK